MVQRGIGLQCIKYSKGQCKSSHYISINKLNEMVIDFIEVAFMTGVFPIVVKNTQAPAGVNEIDIAALIEKEQLKYKRIKEAYEEGVYTVDELKESRRLIDEHIEALRSQEIKPQHTETELRKKIIKDNKNVIQTLRDTSVSEEEKNSLLRSFIDKIIFDRANEKIQIFFYI